MRMGLRAMGVLAMLGLAGFAAPSSDPAAAPAPKRPKVAPPRPATYRNPILRNVADPFVLKHRGEYYLYRTNTGPGLDVFTSRDLVHWKAGPVVWRPSPENRDDIWAPEVYYENGKFYLYFSAGRSGNPRLWVAEADSPLGPFTTDARGPLTEPWRIDASVFRDDDGARYLYCAHRLGPGARVEARRIADAWERADSGWQPMVEASAPWEGIWVEGPTVLKRGRTYFLLYSGPDAESPRYQVGYATAASPLGPWKKRGLLIPTRNAIPGTGHQGVVMAPDNLTPYLVYHRKRLSERGWDRDLMLDRLQVGEGTLSTRAPTLDPQAMPPRPAFQEHFDSRHSLARWLPRAGSWDLDLQEKELVYGGTGTAGRIELVGQRLGDGVVEVNLRRLAGEGSAGLELVTAAGSLPVLLSLRSGTPGLDPDVYHQLLVTRRGASVQVRIDGRPLGQSLRMPAGQATLVLVTHGASAGFDGVAVTPYTEPRPLGPPDAARRLGWHRVGDTIEQRLLGGDLQLFPVSGALTGSAVARVRVRGWALGKSSDYPKYGVRVQDAQGGYLDAYIDPASGVLATHGMVRGREIPWLNSALPLGFDYTDWHELSVTRRGDRWTLRVDGGSAQQRTAPLGPVRVSLVTEDARVAYRDIAITAR
jgi:GH43 family beta-xylosidase